MTFRDKSADTTLDNANMSKEFDTWYLDFLKQEQRTPTFVEGFYARQPEIDALKDSLHRAINDARNFCQICLNNWSEIQRLKAENQQLRADAERYLFLRGDQQTGMRPMRWEVQRWMGGYWEQIIAFDKLDSMIDADMKDSSTTQKEEECDS